MPGRAARLGSARADPGTRPRRRVAPGRSDPACRHGVTDGDRRRQGHHPAGRSRPAGRVDPPFQSRSKTGQIGCDKTRTDDVLPIAQQKTLAPPACERFNTSKFPGPARIGCKSLIGNWMFDNSAPSTAPSKPLIAVVSGPARIRSDSAWFLNELRTTPLPGQSARASLKRGGSAGGRCNAMAALPGQSARASLKPVDPAVRAPINRALPGQSARASLKHSPLRRINHRRKSLSRAKAPGPH